MKKARILSIDGGGIRGILSGTILAYLEEQIQKKTGNPKAHIGDYFDLIAGTSSGGVLGLICITPDDNEKFMYSARNALNIYLENGHKIFDASFRKKIESVGGVIDEKYEAKELEWALLKYFGDKKLSSVLRPCLFTAYDIGKRKAHFFTSIEAGERKEDFYLKDVGRATTAAPTYFEPVLIKSLDGTAYGLIDGGVFANNPALCAYAEARNIKFSKILDDPEKPDNPTAGEMIIISLGNGEVKKPYPYSEFKNAGVLKWIKPLIDIMMSGNSETVDYQLKQLYKTLSPEDYQDYHRIQPEILTADNDLDNGKKPNLLALYRDGIAAVNKNKEQLQEIADKLIANH